MDFSRIPVPVLYQILDELRDSLLVTRDLLRFREANRLTRARVSDYLCTCSRVALYGTCVVFRRGRLSESENWKLVVEVAMNGHFQLLKTILCIPGFEEGIEELRFMPNAGLRDHRDIVLSKQLRRLRHVRNAIYPADAEFFNRRGNGVYYDLIQRMATLRSAVNIRILNLSEEQRKRVYRIREHAPVATARIHPSFFYDVLLGDVVQSEVRLLMEYRGRRPAGCNPELMELQAKVTHLETEQLCDIETVFTADSGPYFLRPALVSNALRNLRHWEARIHILLTHNFIKMLLQGHAWARDKTASIWTKAVRSLVAWAATSGTPTDPAVRATEVFVSGEMKKHPASLTDLEEAFKTCLRSAMREQRLDAAIADNRFTASAEKIYPTGRAARFRIEVIATGRPVATASIRERLPVENLEDDERDDDATARG